MSAEFSVYWWDKDGNYHRELSFVEAEKAVKAAHRLTEGPAAMIGIVEKVMITDGGDLVCFLWTKANGVEFPTKENLEEEGIECRNLN